MKTTFRALALGAALLPWTAAAQTAPQDFLAEYREIYAKLGYTIEVGSETIEGDTLVLGDVAMVVETPQNTVRMTNERWTIRPVQEGAYTLEMVTAPVFTADIQFTDPALGAMPPMNFTYEIPGNRMLIGGTPVDRTFLYTADGMKMSMASEIPDASGQPGKLDMTFGSGAISAEGRLTKGFFGGGYEGTGTLDGLTMDYTIGAPDGTAVVSLAYSGMTFAGAGPFVNLSDPAALFGSRAETGMSGTYQGGTVAVNFQGEGETFVMDSTVGPGTLEAKIGAGRIDYFVSGSQTSVSVSGSSLPFPSAQMTMDNAIFGFAMPLMPGHGVGEMRTEMRFEGLSLSEEIWSLFDPGQAIPRTPATVAVRIASAAEPLVNMMDPEAMASGAAAMPFRFDDVRVEEFLVSAAGAEITAAGSAVVNNVGPIPMPVGGMDVTITGVVGLVQKLVAAGLIPAEQAAAIPAMLGAFAIAAGPDTYTSRIEMTPEGAITANGIPLQ